MVVKCLDFRCNESFKKSIKLQFINSCFYHYFMLPRWPSDLSTMIWVSDINMIDVNWEKVLLCSYPSDGPLHSNWIKFFSYIYECNCLILFRFMHRKYKHIRKWYKWMQIKMIFCHPFGSTEWQNCNAIENWQNELPTHTEDEIRMPGHTYVKSNFRQWNSKRSILIFLCE